MQLCDFKWDPSKQHLLSCHRTLHLSQVHFVTNLVYD
jgi:hypothetical protein